MLRFHFSISGMQGRRSETGLRWILPALMVAAAIQFICWIAGFPQFFEALSLDGIAVNEGEWWRIFTYPLVSAGVFHFFLGVVFVRLLGVDLADVIGRGSLLRLGLLSSVLGGLVSWWLYPSTPACGVGPIMAGWLAASATINVSQKPFFLARFLIMPVCIAALMLAGSDSLLSVAPAGICTGAATGWVWARVQGYGRMFWWQSRSAEQASLKRRKSKMSAEEFVVVEVDPVLEKVSREGMDSLSRAERNTLEAAREKLLEEKDQV